MPYPAWLRGLGRLKSLSIWRRMTEQAGPIRYRGKIIVPVVAGLLVIGCTAQAPVDREFAVSGAGFANVQGETSLVVRAFVPAGVEEMAEVSGAQCRVSSTLFAVDVVTPARLRLPVFGPQSPRLDVLCQAGTRSGEARAAIVTIWRAPPGAMVPQAWPYRDGYPGLWGDWGYGARYPEFRYPNIRVLLR